MRWLVGILAGFILFVLVLVFLIQSLSRSLPAVHNARIAEQPPFELVADEYAFTPFFLNGHGGHPGVIKVIDQRGQVLDSEEMDDVWSVRAVDWGEYSVHFLYYKDGRSYVGSLNLAP